METGLLKVLLSCCLFICVRAQAYKIKEPVKITDANWTSVMDGEWMIELTKQKFNGRIQTLLTDGEGDCWKCPQLLIGLESSFVGYSHHQVCRRTSMAPWCPACKSFKEVWEEFAGWGHDLDISVAVVDVTENPGLSGRFLVTSLPTVYHVKDGMFRQYSGSRKTTDLIELIDEKKWNNIEPVAWYRDPSSLQMGVLGAFFKAAMFFRGIYSTMTEVYGIPEWLCYVIFAILTIVIGLLLGLLLVLCCDSVFPAKYIPLPPKKIAYNPNNIPPNDTDLIDDTIDDSKDPRRDKESDDEHSEPQEGTGEPDSSQTTPVEDSEVRKRQLRKDQ